MECIIQKRIHIFIHGRHLKHILPWYQNIAQKQKRASNEFEALILGGSIITYGTTLNYKQVHESQTASNRSSTTRVEQSKAIANI